MKINVKSLQGDEYTVHLEKNKLVSDLKDCISAQADGLLVDRQKLVYKGRTMQDTSALSDYNLEDGCKVHLILQKGNSIGPKASLSSSPSSSGIPNSASSSCSRDFVHNKPSNPSTTFTTTTTTTTSSSSSVDAKATTIERPSSDVKQSSDTDACNSATIESINNLDGKRDRFEMILKARLEKHFSADAVEKIMLNLHHEIKADINSSSLDDLERLAKQKLNISN